MNYSELSEEIRGYLEEVDEDSFVARIPDFIIQAEQTIYRRTNLPVSRAIDDGNIICVAGTQTVTPPDDFLEILGLSVKNAGSGSNEVRPLRVADEGFVREAYPVPTVTGVPKYFAPIDQQTILLGPTPDQAYPLLFYVKRFPESIVTAGTTWLGDNCEQALLFGSLYQAYLYLKGDADLMEQYRVKFEAELAMLDPESNDVPTDPRSRT